MILPNFNSAKNLPKQKASRMLLPSSTLSHTQLSGRGNVGQKEATKQTLNSSQSVNRNSQQSNWTNPEFGCLAESAHKLRGQGKDNRPQHEHIQVSEFVGEQPEEATLEHNIHRIVKCKQEADSLITQIGSQIEVIRELQRENKQYKTQLRSKEKETQELKSILHMKDLEILQLRQDRDRICRMQAVGAAKLTILKQIHSLTEAEKWEAMLRDRLHSETREIGPAYDQDNTKPFLKENKDSSTQLNPGCPSTIGALAVGTQCVRRGAKSEMIIQAVKGERRFFGRIVKAQSNRRASSKNTAKWEESTFFD